MSSSKVSTNSKSTTVISRFEFKSDSRKVVYLVRSSDGKSVYETSLNAGRACSCSCKGYSYRGHCRHAATVEAIEAARTATVAKAVPQIAAMKARSAISTAPIQYNAFSILR